MLLRVQCGQPLQPPPLFAAKHSGFGSVGLRQKVAEQKMCDGCVRPCGGCWGSRPQLEQQQQQEEEEQQQQQTGAASRGGGERESRSAGTQELFFFFFDFLGLRPYKLIMVGFCSCYLCDGLPELITY